MERVLFESEIFNEEAKGMFPFRIRVSESIANGNHTVQVIREEFDKVGDNLVVKNQKLLNGSVWHE
ncbi:hypothetical protein SAMN05216349_10646 [Oribacterium sp. KHPX15]|uniref:hypothetical protein n=1 Tax=Oribacterium sp. KHPX15 TaxID=1855342 RepID=UPI000896D27E|nr:hypothetical protein [Oribacterium sp. KHPX15]SEA18016.1 hypothetical protein SAMN05216349_10646 [Oribacterium sp. KHPX15]